MRLAAIGIALLAIAGGAAGDAATAVASVVDVLPAGLLDAVYVALARGLHVVAAALAGLLLVTSLALAAFLGARGR